MAELYEMTQTQSYHKGSDLNEPSIPSKQEKVFEKQTSFISAPCTMTLAPYCRHRETFMIGAMIGITTMTGIPRSLPWYASASAWFPALAAITPIFCWGYVQRMKPNSTLLYAGSSVNEFQVNTFDLFFF